MEAPQRKTSLTQLPHQSTPEHQEYELKQRQLSELESKLVELELEHLNLTAELRTLEERYLRIVGTRYAELDQIEAQIAALEAAIHPADQEFKKKASQARTRAEESSDAANKSLEKADPKERTQPSDDLKKLYREVAKRLHPDFASTDEERARRTILMAEANRAYQEGDEAALRRLLENAIDTPDEIVGEGIAFDLVRLIRKIAQVQKRVAEVEQLIDKLKQSPAYTLKLSIEAETQQGRDLLEEMCLDVEEQILQARCRLSALKMK